MASPDVTPYHSMTAHDVLPYELVAEAVADVRVSLPEWNPVEGDPELMIFGAVAQMLSEYIFTVNRLPDAVVQVQAAAFGVARIAGRPAETTLTFTVSQATGVEIPTGTRARVDLGTGEFVTFATSEGGVTPVGGFTVTVPAVAEAIGRVGNNIPPGTTLSLLSALSTVDSVKVTTTSVGGVDPEDDATWFSRYAARASALSDVLARAPQFEAFAASYPGVFRALVLDNFDPTLQVGAPGDHKGHVDIAVLGENGAPVDDATASALLADMRQRAHAGLELHLSAPTITAVPIEVTVKGAAGYSADAVEQAVTAALDVYLNPDSWPWGGVVRVNELITVISNLAEVDYVTALTSPSVDVVLPGVAPLADLGTLTVTVT